MAWQYKLVGKNANYQAGVVEVSVDYFDDVDPTRVLYTAQESFAAYSSLNEIQTRVKQIGAEERRKRSQVDALFNAIPPNASGSV